MSARLPLTVSRLLFLVLGGVCASLSAFAVAVSPEDAASVAAGFARRGAGFGARLGAFVEKTSALTTSSGVRFYAVKMYGGGTVFTSAETEGRPILAFTSATNDFSTLDAVSPLAALLSRDLGARAAVPLACQTPETEAEWMRLAAEGDSTGVFRGVLTAGRIPQPGDVRVPALVASKWGQSTVGGKTCYNYYTPGNAVCGCVATAMSQVMRYHCWPTNAVTARQHENCFYGSSTATARKMTYTTQGGVYDWVNMPLVPTSSISDTERQAIGKLTSDAGIAAEMQYTLSSAGSGTYPELAAHALRNDFGFASAKFLDSTWDSSGYLVSDLRTEATYQAAVLSNLDAGLPVMVGISGSSGGHSIVGDGYGYDGSTLYMHLNMGWSGQDDLWYNLPTVKTTSYSFEYCTTFIYNIFPEKTGAVLSGRILSVEGESVPSAHVTARDRTTNVIVGETTTSASGVYAFVLPAGTYRIEATGANDSETGFLGAVSLALPIETTYSSYYLPYPSGYRTYSVSDLSVVNSESTIGNSWGNDIRVSRDNVTLCVSSRGPDGAVPAEMSPSCGVYSYPRGTEVSLSTAAYLALTNGAEVVYARSALTGFDGLGSVPASGTTNELTLVLTNDTEITWRYGAMPCDYRVRVFESYEGWMFLDEDGDAFHSYFQMGDGWFAADTEISFALPEEASGGESFDWDNYYVRPGASRYLYDTLTLRYSGLLLSEPGYAGDWVWDETRHHAAPTNLTLRMNRGYDVEFVYLPTIDMWTDTLPSWWVYRNLYGSLLNGLIGEGDCLDLADPDGDGFRNASEYRKGTDPLDATSHAPDPFRLWFY